MTTLAERLQAPDLADLEDGQAAAILNTPDPENGTKVRDVPTSDIRALLLATGEWGMIVLASRQVVPLTDPLAPLVAAAIVTVDTMTLTQTLEATNPAFWASMQTMVAGLQGASLLSENTGAAMLAKASAPKSWAEANGYPNGITADDVFDARGRERVIQQE